MIIKRFITFMIAVSLAFSVSTAMAGKSDKSDKSDKSAKHSEKSDKSKKGKGKRGKKGKNSDKSGKSDKSEKSGKSDKEESCKSDWGFDVTFYDASGLLAVAGEITGTACDVTDVAEIAETVFHPQGAPFTDCVLDEETGVLPNTEEELPPYDLDVAMVCSTSSVPNSD